MKKLQRDNKGHFLGNDVEVWEAVPGYFENFAPKKMIFEMGFDPFQDEYVKSWNGFKGKNKNPVFFVAIRRKK